jgi:hypothetical protein
MARSPCRLLARVPLISARLGRLRGAAPGLEAAELHPRLRVRGPVPPPPRQADRCGRSHVSAREGGGSGVPAPPRKRRRSILGRRQRARLREGERGVGRALLLRPARHLEAHQRHDLGAGAGRVPHQRRQRGERHLQRGLHRRRAQQPQPLRRGRAAQEGRAILRRDLRPQGHVAQRVPEEEPRLAAHLFQDPRALQGLVWLAKNGGRYAPAPHCVTARSARA